MLDQRSKPLMTPTSDSDKRIRRPPNAFIIFGNEWRRKLAAEYPEESNKNISVRLGNMWRAMKSEEKKKYMDMACQANAEHKEKYPGYTYNPKEARIRKVLRAVTRDLRSHKNVKGRKANTTRRVKQAGSHHNPVPSRGKESMYILDMIPMANFAAPILITIPAAATTTATQKEQTSATSSNKNSKNSSASTQRTSLEITSTLSDNSGGVIGTENTNSPFPSFKQAFGSEEIGCFSYEELVSKTIHQTENHQSTSNENPNPLAFKLPPYESYVEGLLPESEFMNEILAFDSVASLDNQF
ncbi:transcription factor SOX-6 [Cryptotermes secundus]|uniref:transcription factor SOX-6 n=1 Tax=Cryptotermes secundus TaxID=105785 RepID=UPI000CD7C537|nr:transcription factor SOX-6 [Cryptotermes secundus]